MNSDRIKEIQDGTLAPNSTSVMKALYQVWNECEQEAQATITELEAALSLLDKNNFQHAKPYMVCVPVEVWRKAFPALKEDKS